MNNIAILTCRTAADVCTGASCMQAFNEKTGYFAEYDESARLVAFMQCNGCDSDPPSEDKGMTDKINRLERIQTTCVHIGVCSKTRSGDECETITEIANLIAARGIAIHRGTHA